MSIKVGILMGGPSAERSISLATADAVVQACSSLGYKTVKLPFKHNYRKLLKNMKNTDIVFNALHGGAGENGEIQKWMDDNSINYTGSGSKSSALCMNKGKSKKLAYDNNIKTPKWQVIKDKSVDVNMEFPLIVKPNEQGSTFGLSFVDKKESLNHAIDKAFNFGDEVIIEAYIDGVELTVPILDSRVYPVIEIIPLNLIYDFECKYIPGMSRYICPARINKVTEKKIKNNTKLLFQKFECSVYARADYILDEKGSAYFLEMNTLPGMTSTSLLPKSVNVEGMSFISLIKKIIELSL